MHSYQPKYHGNKKTTFLSKKNFANSIFFPTTKLLYAICDHLLIHTASRCIAIPTGRRIRGDLVEGWGIIRLTITYNPPKDPKFMGVWGQKNF